MTDADPQTPVAEAPNAGKSFLVFLGGLVLLVAIGVGLGRVFFGPEQLKEYDRSTPEAVLEAARDMVMQGDAERLSELLYADTIEMEGVYAQLGVVLGELQDLAMAVNDAFPEEVAKMQADAEAAALEGRGVSLLQELGSGFGGGRRGGPPAGDDEERWNTVLKAIASDPYSWLTDAEEKLSFVPIDDTRVAVLWDGKPVLPPFGLVMQLDRGQWAFVLPTRSIPMSSRFMPQTPEEHQILGAVFQAVGNVLVDLEGEIRSGELATMDALTRATGQKSVPVIMGCMLAYNRAMAARRRAAREAAEAADAGRADETTETESAPDP